MKKKYLSILAMIMALVLMVSMTACGNKDEGGADGGETVTEDATGGDTGADKDSDSRAATEKNAEIIKTIDGIDEDLGPRLPLMIESITLYDDGTVAIVPLDELKKNEIKGDETAVYPFADSGEVEDVSVTDYGNGGYRTVIALMKDGTISAVNGRALVEDHIFAVMDNVGSRDNFVAIETETDESATSIIGITDDGQEIVLDYSMNFDEPESEQNP